VILRSDTLVGGGPWVELKGLSGSHRQFEVGRREE